MNTEQLHQLLYVAFFILGALVFAIIVTLLLALLILLIKGIKEILTL